MAGDADGSVACAGNVFTNTVSITLGLGGVVFDGNKSNGPLIIWGNTGALPPPHSGTVEVQGNTVTGRTHI